MAPTGSYHILVTLRFGPEGWQGLDTFLMNVGVLEGDAHVHIRLVRKDPSGNVRFNPNSFPSSFCGIHAVNRSITIAKT